MSIAASLRDGPTSIHCALLAFAPQRGGLFRDLHSGNDPSFRHDAGLPSEAL